LLAIVYVAVALGVGLLAQRCGVGHQFATFLLAIAFTAWNAGLGPAIVAAIGSSLAYDFFFTPPLYQFGLTKYDLFDIVLYLSFAVVISRFREIRWRAESKLRASEQKYRQLIDASPDAIFVWDKSGHCVLSNLAAARLRGCGQEELIGISIAETYLPEQRHLVRERLDRTDQGVVRFEREFLTKNNERIPVEVSLSHAGEDFYQSVMRDISERKRAEEKLRERANLLALTHDTIFVRDMRDMVTFWNRGAEELYGYKWQEAVGRTSHELLRTDFPEPLEKIQDSLLRTGRWQGELLHTASDGRQFVVSSRWSLQRDEQGNPVAILETNNDITERKAAEEGLRKLNEELEQRVIERTHELQAVNKELEAFAYSVSHDLRAPIRHIAGFTQLLQNNSRSSLDEKSTRYVNMILDAASRMGSLIDDLLAFSRIGRAEARVSDVDLAGMIKSIVSEQTVDGNGRNVNWRIGDLPKCVGDSSMLRLAFANLVSNALKFTRTRQPAEIEINSSGDGADEVVIFVKDNGVGFDMKYKDKLFGVFQRLHSQDAFEGTGIGLATVQRIVHRHGGRVWAESNIDSGATFYVALPKTGKVKL
jgi:PAS domain S-box-containing protein